MDTLNYGSSFKSNSRTRITANRLDASPQLSIQATRRRVVVVTSYRRRRSKRLRPWARTWERLVVLATAIGLTVDTTVAKGNRTPLHGGKVVTPFFSLRGRRGGVNEYVDPPTGSEGGREIRRN